MRWSKPSGDYIMNFYRPKEVSCKKTESGGHTRCPRGRGHAQGGRARPPPSWMPRVLSGLLLIFLFFLNIPKRRKNAVRTVLESVYLLYHIPIPFRSLKHSGKCPLCTHRDYGVNNIGFNIYGIIWDIMLDSLTVYHLRICAFDVVDFDGTGMIDLLNNVRTFLFREKFSCKKS